jgi:pilus assembly protein CpaE
MAATGNLTRVVAIGDPGPTQQQITTALSAQDEFQLVDILASTERLVREVRAAEPDIILVDHLLGGQPTLDIIDDLALQFPKTSIVAMLPGEDPLKAQQVMLAGARAFLVHPFTQLNLLSTLRRVRDLDQRLRQAMPAQKSLPLCAC